MVLTVDPTKSCCRGDCEKVTLRREIRRIGYVLSLGRPGKNSRGGFMQLRVLIVDDSKLTRRVLPRWLALDGRCAEKPKTAAPLSRDSVNSSRTWSCWTSLCLILTALRLVGRCTLSTPLCRSYCLRCWTRWAWKAPLVRQA